VELIYTERNWLALLGAIVCAGALALVLTLRPLSQETRTEGPIMHVSLAAPVEPPPVAVPATPTPATPRPTRSPTSPAAPTQAPSPQPQAPSAAPSLPQALAAPAMPSAPSAAQIESAYAAVVRQRIEQEKVYPTSREARIQHPEGAVECWFVLSRDGALVDAGVLRSAGGILDRQALVTIRRSRYAPFPQEAFVGEGQHRFTVELAFRLS
jgi:protein TonB